MSHKSRSKAFIYGYNCQIAVDSKSQIIVSQLVHNKAQDYQALPKLIDQLEKEYGGLPEEVLADLGYKSLENIVTLENKGIEATIAPQSSDYEIEEKLEAVECIHYDEKNDSYYCPMGKDLSYYNRKGKNGRVELSLKKMNCSNCKLKKECLLSQKNTVSVPRGKKLEIYQKYLKKVREASFLKSYRDRKHIVEPVFGNIKNKGIKIRRIGTAKVETWFSLACMAHNIEKIVKKEQDSFKIFISTQICLI